MRKRIFIIEDDANLLYALQAKFSLNGSKIKISNGNNSIAEVLNELKEFKPNFVIIDLILPNINGFELIREIKKDDMLSIVPVFVFTNLADKDSKNKLNSLGVNYYFLKSDFSIDGFVEKVEKIIANRIKLGN